MTTQKTFKRRVRARMAKTGESYTAARRQLINAGDQPDPGTPTFQTVVSDERMVEATGHRHDEWFARLDAWGGTTHTHTEIARYVVEELGVPGWWAQSITVSYERARGMRAVGQMRDGWRINASKTVNVAVEELFDAVVEERLRKEWLPDVDLGQRTATRPKSARFDWEDGSTRVVVTLEAKGPSKATVFVSHERLPDADTAEAMKAYWRSALVDLKAHLESGGAR
jgi:uncharacterized protein YndB with AHSA1/START domain